MKTVLVTGARGQLGCSLQVLVKEKPGYRFLFTDVDTLDICNREAVASFVQDHQVDYIMNCAAFTAVDKAEAQEELCDRINHQAVRNLAEAARQYGAKVIHVSTDYVFDGTSCRPYVESDPTSPVSVYGRTKLAGEQVLMELCPEAVILRTAWLYSEYGTNFVKTMLRLGAEREVLRVVFDQVGTPTYATDLAKAMLVILDADAVGQYVPGIYHFSNEGVCSWYDFAYKIIQLSALPARVYPIESKEYPSAAARPPFSVLNKGKIKSVYGVEIPHWEASLKSCLGK